MGEKRTWSPSMAVGEARLSETLEKCSPAESCYGDHKRRKTFDTSSMPWTAKLRSETKSNDVKTSPFALRDSLEGWGSDKYGSVSKDISGLLARKMQILGPCFSDSKCRDGKTSQVVDVSAPFSLLNWPKGLDSGKYGSVSKDIEELLAQKMRLLNPLLARYPLLQRSGSDTAGFHKDCNLLNQQPSHSTSGLCDIIDLEDCMEDNIPVSEDSLPVYENDGESNVHVDGGSSPIEQEQTNQPEYLQSHSDPLIVILDSDEEDGDSIRASNSELPLESQKNDLDDLNNRGALMADTRSLLLDVQYQQGNNELVYAKVDQIDAVEANGSLSYPYEKAVLRNQVEEKPIRSLHVRENEEESISKEEQGVYVGAQVDQIIEKGNHPSADDDDLGDVWREMTVALECSKDTAPERSAYENIEGGGEECDHSFVLKDDLGYVCRVCGIIERGIETIFDFQWIKGTKTTRTYFRESQNLKGRQPAEVSEVCQLDFTVAELSVHPRHRQQMKPHQVEGFNFLQRNLMTEKPGGCILAHAPGSGKTFMIISFMQSFLARYPKARPLVVLPKGILATWRKEFQRWQVEDIPLYDFYSMKAENRDQQLEVMKMWVDQSGILFLGYQQFANIVCGSATSKTAAACHDMLLKVPSILILDEGHTPRNEDTNVLHSLAKVQTPRKVVLSGTLFQNHVKEVFNILNLVRPKFLKLESSRLIVKRVLSRVQISGGKKFCNNGIESAFYELVEATLLNNEDFKRKITVIKDLREMTNDVLHYYKGDFLEELPGLVNFTVLLNLTSKQKSAVEKLKNLDKFKRCSVGSAVYMHPRLKEFSETASAVEKNIDDLVGKMDVKEGVKTRFFLNLLDLCESAGEKLLVFSQYLLPLKFLERLIVATKGWYPGKEIFMISGDSTSEQRERSMDHFNNSPDAKVFFGSIKACGEGISLVGASRVLILDVHLNPSVTRQAIGRAFRPGQERKVYTYRLVAADSPEEQDHLTSFRKELIAKMWFEWSECCSHQNFEMESVDVRECGDCFLESPLMGRDVRALYKR